MRCPFCNSQTFKDSWFGSTIFNGREFHYKECTDCRSLLCNPMPDIEILAEMYGPGYTLQSSHSASIDDPRDRVMVIEWLKRLEKGTFVDYGCGDGELLREVKKLGWDVIGVEFDAEVAHSLKKRLGIDIITASEIESIKDRADVLHLGDVIEHLTDVNYSLPQILNTLKKGGILLAQGPLEANPNLFLLLLKITRRLKGSKVSTIPPYHVLLATAEGQKRMFERFGLKQLMYDVTEVSWPAPHRLQRTEIFNLRALGLFSARRCSQITSRFYPSKLGNRYFYAGTLQGLYKVQKQS
jgi:SAM-dependent methyltransferase